MLTAVKIGAMAFVGVVGMKAASVLSGGGGAEAVLALASPASASVAEASVTEDADVVWDGSGTLRRARPGMSEPGAPAAGEGGPGDALPELLAAIAAEHEVLAARAAELDLRAAEIELARSALLSQNRQLDALRAELNLLLDRAQADHDADITRLVKIYEAMKPDAAAAIMQEADIELAVLVMSAMAERSSGPIMAAMAPVRANAISRVILERARLPGDREPVIVRLD